MHSRGWFCIWLFCLCYFPVHNIFVTNGKVISQENKWHFIVCMFAIVCSWLWIGWIEQFWWPTSVLVFGLEGQSSWGAIRIDWNHIEIEICWYNSTDYMFLLCRVFWLNPVKASLLFQFAVYVCGCDVLLYMLYIFSPCTDIT